MSFNSKQIEREKEKESLSDWNAGVDFYDTLIKLRKAHIYSFSTGYLVEAVELLSSEIDWVSTDIGKDNLDQLRKDIDSVLNKLNKFDNIINNNNIKYSIVKIRRTLWDLEMLHNITRPNNNDDFSDTPMPQINQR